MYSRTPVAGIDRKRIALARLGSMIAKVFHTSRTVPSADS